MYVRMAAAASLRWCGSYAAAAWVKLIKCLEWNAARGVPLNLTYKEGSARSSCCVSGGGTGGVHASAVLPFGVL
jgi:hypothetical protein